MTRERNFFRVRIGAVADFHFSMSDESSIDQ
jgi:hypothetical protein